MVEMRWWLKMQCSGELVVVVEMMRWLFQTFSSTGSVILDFYCRKKNPYRELQRNPNRELQRRRRKNATEKDEGGKGRKVAGKSPEHRRNGERGRCRMKGVEYAEWLLTHLLMQGLGAKWKKTKKKKKREWIGSEHP